MEYNNNRYKYVGGVPYCPGAKYNSLDLLFKDYYKLLVRCLLNDGVEFTSNGIWGKIKLESEGFVLYTKLDNGFENFGDEMEKRLVSADFVLLMFDRECMSNFYNLVKMNPNIGSSLEEDPSYVVEQYLKIGKAAINNSDSLAKNQVYISSLYSLVRKIIEYSMWFQIHNENMNIVNKLKQVLSDGKREYGDFSEEEKELFRNNSRYSGRYEDFPEFYFSLGCFGNFVRHEALNNIYKMKNSVNVPTNLSKEQSISYCKGDPVIYSSDFAVVPWSEDLLIDELNDDVNWLITLNEGIIFVPENKESSIEFADEEFSLPAIGYSPRGRGKGSLGGGVS